MFTCGVPISPPLLSLCTVFSAPDTLSVSCFPTQEHVLHRLRDVSPLSGSWDVLSPPMHHQLSPLPLNKSLFELPQTESSLLYSLRPDLLQFSAYAHQLWLMPELMKPLREISGGRIEQNLEWLHHRIFFLLKVFSSI